MAISAMSSAASGMKSMDTQLDVIGNNLANSGTHGFKASRVNFEDLYYEERRQPGALNNLGQATSTGLFVGLGSKVSNTQLDFSTGAFETTEQPLDMAIAGKGFFKVTTFDGIGQGIAYTRAGNFTVNNVGQLVLGTSNGPILDPPINIPNNADIESITILGDGRVTAQVDGTETEVGQIQLTRFPNPHGLRLEGGNLYTETEASGAPIDGNPTDDGLGEIKQRVLESSNVDSVRELIKMIRTQRHFELNSQVIRAADSTMQTIGQLAR